MVNTQIMQDRFQSSLIRSALGEAYDWNSSDAWGVLHPGWVRDQRADLPLGARRIVDLCAASLLGRSSLDWPPAGPPDGVETLYPLLRPSEVSLVGQSVSTWSQALDSSLLYFFRESGEASQIQVNLSGQTPPWLSGVATATCSLSPYSIQVDDQPFVTTYVFGVTVRYGSPVGESYFLLAAASRASGAASRAIDIGPRAESFEPHLIGASVLRQADTHESPAYGFLVRSADRSEEDDALDLSNAVEPSLLQPGARACDGARNNFMRLGGCSGAFVGAAEGPIFVTAKHCVMEMSRDQPWFVLTDYDRNFIESNGDAPMWYRGGYVVLGASQVFVHRDLDIAYAEAPHDYGGATLDIADRFDSSSLQMIGHPMGLNRLATVVSDFGVDGNLAHGVVSNYPGSSGSPVVESGFELVAILSGHDQAVPQFVFDREKSCFRVNVMDGRDVEPATFVSAEVLRDLGDDSWEALSTD